MARRKKTAQSKKIFKFNLFLIIASFFGLFLIIASFFSPKNQFQKIRDDILKKPSNTKLRLSLVEVYLENGQFEEAEKEIERIENFFREKNQPIPDNQKEKLKNLSQKKNEQDPKEIIRQLKEWSGFSKKYPDYPPAYLEIALLHLKLGQKQEALIQIQKALDLFPNYETAKNLQKTFF